MIPHEADVYRTAYKNGARLRGYEEPLDKNLRHMDDEPLWTPELNARLAAYVIGFSDGWHGVTPCH